MPIPVRIQVLQVDLVITVTIFIRAWMDLRIYGLHFPGVVGYVAGLQGYCLMPVENLSSPCSWGIIDVGMLILPILPGPVVVIMVNTVDGRSCSYR